MLIGNYEDDIFYEDVLLIWDWFGIDLAHASYAFEVWHDDPWICYAFEDAMQYVVMIIVYKMLKKLIGICCPSSWGTKMDWCLKLRELSYILVELTGD